MNFMHLYNDTLRCIYYTIIASEKRSLLGVIEKECWAYIDLNMARDHRLSVYNMCVNIRRKMLEECDH